MAIHGTIKSIVRSTDGAAMTGKGFLYGITVSGAAGAVVIEDNASVAGSRIIMEANGMGHYFLPVPIPVSIGIAVNLTSNIVTTYYAEAP